MPETIEQIRHVCALGALQTVLAIPRAVPILHAGPGCGQKLWGALAEFNGYQGSGYTGGHCVPCTNMAEKEVIFGGEDRLRAEIENAFKVMDGDLFVVLTGCTADIVGDDVGGVVKAFQDVGRPVVHVETGGFKASNLVGHELILEAIAEQYLQPAELPQANLVNLWAPVPYQDTFWAGDIDALSGLLGGIGLDVNVIFGLEGGIEALKRVPSAQFNLLVGPWAGLRTVELLQRKFGTPFLHYPVLPIGPTETGAFLQTVGEFAEKDRSLVEEVIARHERRYYHYIERCADFLFESRSGMPSRFIAASGSYYAVGITRFLTSDLGLIPERVFVVDGAPEEHWRPIQDSLTDIVEDITAPVVFTSDGAVVEEELHRIRFRGRPLIIGSTWDRVIARELNGFQLSVSLPVSDRLVLDRTYVGYDGALRLVEDICSVVLGDYQ